MPTTPDERTGRPSPPKHPTWHALAAVLFMAAAPALGDDKPGDAPRIANRNDVSRPDRDRTAIKPPASPVVDMEAADPVAAAVEAVARCKARYASVNDYTCTFVKKEKFGEKLHAPHVTTFKARSNPFSVYMKFKTPHKGREVIFVAGRNKGNVVAHDAGLFKVLAGTMSLDPKGDLAMDGCRHPVTEAGIGALIDTVSKHWARELTTAETRVTFQTDLHIGAANVTMIESTHTERRPDFLFHTVKLYVDHATGLPVRFEGYNWPKTPGGAPDLAEEYTYTDLKVNVGLTDADFDAANRLYSFGRF